MLTRKRGLALIITHVDPTSNIGGAERFVETLMKVYSTCNLLPVLVTTSGFIRPRITRTENGYVIVIPSVSLGFVNLAPLSMKMLRFVLNLLKNATVVHVVYCETPVELLFTLIARLLNKKIIASPLAFVVWLFHHSKLIRILAAFTTGIKFVITRVASIAHVASLYDKYYVEKVNKRVYLIPHGITPPPEHIECPEEFRHRFREKYVIGFLGRFTESKGAFVILDLLYLLRVRYGIEAHLLVIGPRHIALYSLLKYAKKNPRKYVVIRDHITITGYVDEEKKYKLLKCCDLGIIASLSDPIEAFSFALSEFNYAGIPVIGCLVGSLKTRLLPCAGIGTSRCNAEELARALIQLFSTVSGTGIHICTLPDVITRDKEEYYFRQVIKVLSEFALR